MKKLISLSLLCLSCLLLCVFTQPNQTIYADSTPSITCNNLGITLTNAQDISIDKNSMLYITNNSSDSTAGSYIVYDLNSNKTLNTIQVTHPDYPESSIIPKNISVNYSNQIIMSYNNINSITYTSINQTDDISHIRSYFNSSNNPQSLNTIVDVITTLNGDIYAIDNNGLIIKKASNSDKFLFYFDTQKRNITEAKLAVSLDDQTLLLLVNNEIYNFNNNLMTCISNSANNVYSLPTFADETNIISILLDHKNDLYTLIENNSTYQIIHSTKTANTTIDLSIDTSNDNNVVDFCINADNGTAYVLQSKKIVSVTAKIDNINFFNSLNDEDIPIDITNYVPTTAIDILTINTDTTLYKYQNYLLVLDTLQKDTKVLLLNNNSDDEFYYILAVSKNKNNIGFIKKSSATLVNNKTTRDACRLVLENINVYSLPTSTSISVENPTTHKSTTKTNLIIDTISKYDQNGNYNIIAPLNSATMPLDYNNIQFIPVTYTKNNVVKYGYVNNNEIIENDCQPLEKTFVTNATTRNAIDVFSDNDLDTKCYSLKKDAKVKVIETKNDICLIQWLDNGTLCSGYVAHKYIDDGKFSNYQIFGLCLMGVAIIGAIVISIINHKRKLKARDINSDFDI